MIGLPSDPPTETTMQSASDVQTQRDRKIVTALKITANELPEGKHRTSAFDALHLIGRLYDATQAPAPAGIDDAAIKRAVKAWCAWLPSEMFGLDTPYGRAMRAAISAAAIVPSTPPQAGGVVPAELRELSEKAITPYTLNSVSSRKFARACIDFVRSLLATSPEPPAASPVEGDWSVIGSDTPFGEPILCSGFGEIYVARWDGDSWLDHEGRHTWQPCFWRQLPAPPATRPSTEAGLAAALSATAPADGGICERCKGSGRVGVRDDYDGHPCPVCGGSGLQSNPAQGVVDEPDYDGKALIRIARERVGRDVADLKAVAARLRTASPAPSEADVKSSLLAGEAGPGGGVAALSIPGPAARDPADVRREALEEAANVCATLAETDLADGDAFEAALTCEAAIRRLIDNPAQAKTGESRHTDQHGGEG